MQTAELSAEALLAVVRVHADRVHDAVRRLGCGPEAAVEVVEESALDLIDSVAAQPEAVPDPIGWWFARARALGRQAAGGDDALPRGGGVLGVDANQVRLAEALESRPERERAALLLRDSYDLPASAVGTALGLQPGAAMQVVAAARLAFLPALLGGTAKGIGDHDVDLAALGRLGEGGPLAARDATTRRHVQSCERCADLLDVQERARRLLVGLTVVAMPDAAREQMLDAVGQRARQVLPAPAVVVDEDPEDWEDEAESHRWYSLSLMALGVVLAIGLGIGIGVLVSRPEGISPTAANDIPLVTQAPVIRVVPPTLGPTPTLTASPAPKVFFLTPSPQASPTATASVTATPTTSSDGTTEPLSLELSPTSGPNDTQITVTGRGWTPGGTVNLSYVNQVSQTPGSTAVAQVGADGRFSTTLPAHDPQGLPGNHQVIADDGTHNERATFTAG